MAFVHLHNHTDYSMLDGATRISDMVARALEFNMPAIAITDHGYLYGAPTLAQETDAINHSQPDYIQWQQDCKLHKQGKELIEPSEGEVEAHKQWVRDTEAIQAGKDLKEVRPIPKIKPIYGCEVYFVPQAEDSSGKTREMYHMILLAKNETGYKNLLEMISIAATDDFYYRPRVTLENLKAHAEGLVATSACVAGIIPAYIMKGKREEAKQWALTFKDIFAPGDFYLEIQEHGESWHDGWDDHTLSQEIVSLAHEIGVKVVATNDFHYLTRQDAGTQDLVECIGTRATIYDENRLHMTQTAPQEGEYYLKSEQEMRELFSWYEAACDTTLEIADKCNYEIDWSQIYLPKFPFLREGESSEQRFKLEVEKGLKERYGDDWQTKVIGGISVKDRFETEYRVICEKGFADYFLIVQEYIAWAKENGIGVGPGRGSAAGAIVAYALGITGLDPLENGLMFERFLSPERSEMPDIDVDFDEEQRDKVIQHVRDVYGHDHVSQVIAFSTIGARQAINDVARVMGQPVALGQKLAKMVSSDPQTKLLHVIQRTQGHEDHYNPELNKLYQEDKTVHDVLDGALAIEGLIRGEQKHACATLITPTPVTEHVPVKYDLKKDAEKKVEITQFEGTSLASMGLLKMDFLGLRTLTVIDKALQNIKANNNSYEAVQAAPKPVKDALKDGAQGIDIDVDKIPFDDPLVFDLLGQGRTAGVFQVESAGMTATIKLMQPREYRQVVALIALYRPGPLNSGMVDSYIRRMRGREKVTSYDPRFASILDETYGTMVYQEQVMQISMQMSGFSAGESDSRIRKPVAKKKIKLLKETVFPWEDGSQETTYEHWMNGAIKNGYTKQTAQKIWDDVLEFASYAFNKSHSAGYAVLVMQTAWLKAYYPREYMAAVLTSYVGSTDKIVHYVVECKKEGLHVMQPDINESGIEFTALSDGIRFGLAGIKGVGEGVAEAIIEERNRSGAYKDIYDFIERLQHVNINRSAIEALIVSGAFDSTGYTRLQLMKLVDKHNSANIVDALARQAKQTSNGQTSLLELLNDAEGQGFKLNKEAPDGIEYDFMSKLKYEHGALGLYVSDHPLSRYDRALTKNRDYTINDVIHGILSRDENGVSKVVQVPERKPIKLAGMLKDAKKIYTKRQEEMARVLLEDMDGEIELVIFPKTYARIRSIIQSVDLDEFVPVVAAGYIERSDRGDQFIVNDMKLLDIEGDQKQNVLQIFVPSRELTHFTVDQIKGTLQKYPGSDRSELLFQTSDGSLMRVETPSLIDASSRYLTTEIRAIIGDEGAIKVS